MTLRTARVRVFLPGGIMLDVNGTESFASQRPHFRDTCADAMAVAVKLARLAEPVQDIQDHVKLVCKVVGGQPEVVQRSLMASSLAQTAAVVADRAVRKRMHALPTGGAVVLAISPRWWEGRLEPLPPADQAGALQALLAQPDLGEVMVLLPGESPDTLAWSDRISQRHPKARVRMADHLLGFSGNMNNLRRPQWAEVWFPLLGGAPGEEALYPLRVVVSPVHSELLVGEPVEVVGSESKQYVEAVRAVIRAVRFRESTSQRHWQTVVQLPPISLSGNSYQLALAVADRMARGREWPGPGRVIATGGIDAERDRGLVMDVDNKLASDQVSKTELIRGQLLPGDTVLLPDSWVGRPDLGFDLEAMAEDMAGPQVLFIKRVPVPDIASL